MATAASALGKVHLRNIIKRSVFKFEPTATSEEAVTTFLWIQISGASVVDGDGKLLGVIPASDITRLENMRAGKIDVQRNDYTMRQTSPDEDESYDEEVVLAMEDYSPEVLAGTTVADLMSTDLAPVSPDATLKQVCAQFVREHAHRVMVVERAELFGIVSSRDAARCVAEAL